MKQLFAKVIHIESEEDDRYHVTVTVDVFGEIDQFKLEGIDADPDASPVSDINEGTYSIGFSGPGKPPFKVGDLIPVRAFERGELPA